MAKRLLKMNDAFESYLNRLIRDCNISHTDLKNPITINNLGSLVEMTLKEIFTPREMSKSKIKYSSAVEESLKKRFFYTPPKYTLINLDNIDKTFKIINSHKNHQQRSNEWYVFRWSHLTASDLAKALGEKGDKSRWDLIHQKSMTLDMYIRQRESFSLGGQPAIQHGVCFEAVAISLYELKNNLKVKEYGCLPHLYVDYLAASPDGICDSRLTNPDYHGRMLEIKCPYSRVITGIPKLEYYMQVQLQLEVCDLEYCDFLECDIRTYNNMTEFLQDSPKDKTSYCYTKSGNRKGVIYEYREKGGNSSKYKYCPLEYTCEEVSHWIKKTKEEILSNIVNCGIGCKYWWIEEYNTVLIKRDQEYFDNMKIKLDDFWRLVMYYKNEDKFIELEQKLGMKPKPPPKLEFIEFITEEEVKNKSLEDGSSSVNSNSNSNSNPKEEMTYLQFSKQESENIDDFNQLDFIDDIQINSAFSSRDEIKNSISSSSILINEKEIDLKIKKLNNSNLMFVKPEDD
jgi:putative phage-type endonuclease